MLKHLLTAVTLLSLSLSANAASSSFAISGTYSQGAGQSDLSATNISLGGAGSFTLDPGSSGNYFDFQLPGSGTFSTTSDSIDGYHFLQSYAAGDTVGRANFGNDISAVADWDTILSNGSTAGVWGTSHDGYLGFLTDASLFGYIQYNFTRALDVSTIQFFSGAFETVASNGITIPSAVPVPAALFLFAPALLGFMGFRRKTRALAA